MNRNVETSDGQSGATLDTALTIDVDTLRARLERGEPTFVLDVRPVAERAEWAIPGSVHLDAYQALRAGDPHALLAMTPPSNAPVVTVCAVGRTSRIAADQLRKRGVAAWSLSGGMKAWSLAWNTAELSTEDATLVQVRRTGKG